MSQNNEVSYILNEPIVWEGDLDDDCTVRDWHGMMGRAEAMSEWSWFCCVYRGKETLMHNSTDGFNPNSGESARKLVEMYMRLEALRGLVAPAPEPQGESREEKCPACGKATSRWVASGSLVEQCCHCGEILGDAPAAPESGERTADNMLHRLWTKAAANANDDYDKAEWLELERLISKPKETADVQLAVEDAGPACVRLDEVGKEAGELRPSSGLQRGLRPVPEGQDGDRVHANMAGADVQGMRQDAARATEALASSPPAGESEMPNKETTCDTSSSAPPLDGSSSATQSPAGQGDSQVPLQASGSDREQAGEMDLSVFEGHTEGPWRIFSTNAARESEIVGPNHGDGREEWIADTFDFGNNESLANARLIAAAPRLLSELKRTREEVQNQKLFGVSQMNEIRSLNSQVATLQARVADAEREVAPARKILEEYMVLKMDWSGDDLNRAMKACRLMVEADNKRIAAEARVADTQRALAEAAEVNEVRAARVAELERDRASNVSQMTRDLERLDRIGEALGGCAPEQSVEERAIEVGARVKELEDRVSKRDMRIKELFGGCACRDFPGQMREPKIVCLYHQAKAKEAAAQAAELSRLTTERDRLAGQLAATVENYKLTVASWNAEDSRLRQQLAAEQARLDWVLANEVDSVILVDFPEGVREAIDAEMKNPQSKYIQSNYMAIARQQLAERDVEIAELEASQADYRDCIELAGKIAEGIECYDGDDLAGEIVPYLKPVVGELDALRQQLAETVGALKVANLKNAHSLANNLCPDHRDKQQGKPCLACEIERLRAGEAEVRQALVAMFVDAISGMADAAIINADQTYDYRNTAAAVRQLSEEHKKLRLQPHSEEVSSLTRQLEEARGLIGMYPEFHACLDQTACPDGWVECPICEGGGSDSGKKNKPTHKPGCPRGKFSQSTSPAVEEAGKGDGSGSEGVA